MGGLEGALADTVFGGKDGGEFCREPLPGFFDPGGRGRKGILEKLKRDEINEGPSLVW